MEPTYEGIAEWLDGYFAAVNKNQGPIETVVNLREYFTPDFEFVAYTVQPAKQPLSREDLLLLFVHPGLQEDLTPNYYVIDVKRLIAVAQFEERFTDRSSGTSWPPVQASAHYHLVLDKDRGFRIKKIQFWVETFTDVFASMFQTWEAYRQKALADLAKGYLNTKP
jgi:hypothetical protein